MLSTKRKKSSCILRAATLALSLLLLCSAHAPSAFSAAAETKPGKGSRTPVLQLAFVSETRGQINPCAMCSVVALGGLAQRSTYLKSLRDSGTPLLTIFGSREFMADNTEGKSGTNWRNKVSPKQMLDFYNRLEPDLMYASTRAIKWFGSSINKLPAYFVPVDNAPVTKIVERNGKRIGVVFFNEVPVPTDIKSSLDTLAQANKVGEKLSKEVDLLVGVSPWGSSMELTMLNNNKFYHVLIGGGDGPAFSTYPRVQEPTSMIWARPQPEAKAVSTVSIYDWPNPKGAAWKRGLNYDADTFVLGRTYPSDFNIQRRMPKAN